jgi:hypothetical protein
MTLQFGRQDLFTVLLHEFLEMYLQEDKAVPVLKSLNKTPCKHWNGSTALPFLKLVLYVSKQSVSHPSNITPRETAFDTHWIGGTVSPRAILDVVEKKNK